MMATWQRQQIGTFPNKVPDPFSFDIAFECGVPALQAHHPCRGQRDNDTGMATTTDRHFPKNLQAGFVIMEVLGVWNGGRASRRTRT
ncbi:MAG: hypothetical protein LBT53_01885, partial [Puniceicoccales bacterium]|nr:hypothetical protein [Puniceicoccales bacterium]